MCCQCKLKIVHQTLTFYLLIFQLCTKRIVTQLASKKSTVNLKPFPACRRKILDFLFSE